MGKDTSMETLKWVRTPQWKPLNGHPEMRKDGDSEMGNDTSMDTLK